MADSLLFRMFFNRFAGRLMMQPGARPRTKQWRTSTTTPVSWLVVGLMLPPHGEDDNFDTRAPTTASCFRLRAEELTFRMRVCLRHSELAAGAVISISANGKELVKVSCTMMRNRAAPHRTDDCIPIAHTTSAILSCACCDSQSQSKAVSGGVDPSANVVTVVNDLSSRGITLKAGELVITGAVAVTKACQAGDHVVVSYEGIGQVSCTLAGMAMTASL